MLLLGVYNANILDAHVNGVRAKGTAQIRRTDFIHRKPHLDTDIKGCILLNVIVSEVEYTKLWEQGSTALVNTLETVQMATAKIILGHLKATTNIHH